MEHEREMKMKYQQVLFFQEESESLEKAYQLSIQQQERDQRQRQLVEEQDRLYQMSLERDREKEEIKRVQLERERIQSRQNQILHEKQDLSDAILLSTQLAQEEEWKQKLKNIQIPEEPTEGDILHILIFLPNGDKLKRKFRPSETLQTVKDYIDVQFLEENDTKKIPRNYKIITDFPRTVWSDTSSKLGDLGFQKNISFRVEKEEDT